MRNKTYNGNIYFSSLVVQKLYRLVIYLPLTLLVVACRVCEG